MLSMFESALLDRHLRGCSSCRAFAVNTGEQVALLRAAPLEELERSVAIPSTPAFRVGRRAVGAFGASLAAIAAAAVAVWSAAGPSTGTPSAVHVTRAGAPVMVVFAASPSVVRNDHVEVPRLRMQPASIADGPVHGFFSAPA